MVLRANRELSHNERFERCAHPCFDREVGRTAQMSIENVIGAEDGITGERAATGDPRIEDRLARAANDSVRPVGMQAHQAHQVVGEYRGVNVRLEMRQPTPAAASEAEATFQIGNTRFDTRPNRRSRWYSHDDGVMASVRSPRFL